MFVAAFVAKKQKIMATLHFAVLKSRRTVKKTYSVYLAITHKRVVRYITTEYEVEDLYQFHNGKVVCRKDAKIFNQRLEYLLTEYQQKLDQIPNQNCFSCSQIKELLERKDTNLGCTGYSTLVECLQAKINDLRRERRDSYADMNEETLKRVKTVLGEVTLASMNPFTIELFFKSMDGLSNATKQMSLSHVKACINAEIKKGNVKYDIHPFAYTKMPKAPARLLDLTIEEFQKIVNMKSNSKRLNLAKDMFLLSFYLGGINLADLVTLNFKDIIAYERKKTTKKKEGESIISFSLPEKAKPIIKKYISRNGKLEFGYKYPYKNFQLYLNKCLKLMGNHLDIQQNICFYSARKTFSQFAYDLGIRMEIIEYCLGQTMKENRPIYNYVRVMQRQADAALQMVIAYTENPDKFELSIKVI